MQLLKRQDLISLISQRLTPSSDKVSITITLEEMDPFVLCIGTKKSLATLQKIYQDVVSLKMDALFRNAPSTAAEGGGQGGRNSPRRRITADGAKKSQQCHKYFLQQLICSQKTSGSNMWAPSNFVTPPARRVPVHTAYLGIYRVYVELFRICRARYRDITGRSQHSILSKIS